jgi:hypothetical protein
MIGKLDGNLIEDIQAAAPDVQILTLHLIDTEEVNLTLFTSLSSLADLTLGEGEEVQEVQLDGVEQLKELIKLEVNLAPERPIPSIDLSLLQEHPELRVITIATPLGKLEGLDALSTIPGLESVGFYALELPNLDLSPLSNGPNRLESIYLGNLGQEGSDADFQLILPSGIPLKLLEVTDFIGNAGKLSINYSFLKGRESIDNLTLLNCGLLTFDMKVLAHLKRIGSLNLTENRIQRLDITPIIDIPMFTEAAFGEEVFAVDPEVIIEISRNRKNDVNTLTSREAALVPDHDGHFAIEYEFSHEWLEKLLSDHSVEWK